MRPSVTLCCLFGVCPASAYGGAIVTLVPSHPGPYHVNDPSSLTLNVDVLLRLDKDSPASSLFVLARFDTSDSDVPVQGVVTHPESSKGQDFGPISFWDLSSTETCQEHPASCGAYYLLDSNFDDEMVQLFLSLLILPTSADRFELSQSMDTRIGVAQVTLPSSPGTYRLDFLNSDDQDPDRGARLVVGLGIPSMPSMTYTAREGTMTGGSYSFTVIPEPSIGLMLLACTACLLVRRFW